METFFGKPPWKLSSGPIWLSSGSCGENILDEKGDLATSTSVFS